MFEFTEAKLKGTVRMSIAAAVVSIAMCTFILGTSFWIYRKPQARHLLNRVSFRLLLWSMAFEAVYDVAYIANAVEGMDPATPNPLCAADVYWMLATLGVVNYLCTCIAINLMLTICFDINPIERRLERWYVGVSVFLGIAIPIVPAALDHFGRDPILEVCWWQASDDSTRMIYFVLDLYLWQMLSCLIASVAVIMTLVTLLKQRILTSRAMMAGNDLLQVELRKSPGTTLGHLEDQFLKIAVRISMYPISLIIVNGIITLGDLYMSRLGGINSTPVFVLYIIYYFLYGGRGIVFAALGIFVDPCLWRGIKAAWRVQQHRDIMTVQNLSTVGTKHDVAKRSFLDILAEETPNHEYDLQATIPGKGPDKLGVQIGRGRGNSIASIELSQALKRLPYETAAPAIQTETPLEEQRTPAYTFTKSFSGVRSGSLPAGLTDDVDVELRQAMTTRQVKLLSPQMEWRRMADLEEGRVVMEDLGEPLEPLDPDLPDADEERRRRRRAQQVAREEAVRLFEETQAQL